MDNNLYKIINIKRYWNMDNLTKDQWHKVMKSIITKIQE